MAGSSRSTVKLLLLVVAGAAFVVAFGLRYFGPLDDPHFGPRLGMLRVHILFGALPLVLGPLQFIDRLRRARPALHRALGRVYAACVLVGGVTGLLLAPWANGGVIGRLGFAGLALAWLVTTGAAVYFIRTGRVRRHREWMLRSYVVTLAFVWVRLVLGVSLIAGFNLQTAFAIAAWASWVVPLGIAQVVLRAPTPPPGAAPAGQPAG